METVTDSYGITYRIVNGTAFHVDTPPEVVSILENNLSNRRAERLNFHFGDRETGRAWGDIDTGYVGRSTGRIKIPLVVYNARSLGGPALLDHCIVKITTARGKRVLYEHPHYHEE